MDDIERRRKRREKSQRQRDRAKLKGNCSCGKPRDNENKSCNNCIERNRLIKLRLRKEGRCSCGTIISTESKFTHCERCLSLDKNRRLQLKTENKCTRCQTVKIDDLPCEKCKTVDLKLKEYRKAHKLCMKCATPLIDNNPCIKCKDKREKRKRKREEDGKCIKCGDEKDQEGKCSKCPEKKAKVETKCQCKNLLKNSEYKTCEYCRGRDVQRRKKYRVDGLCITCGRSRDTENLTCSLCVSSVIDVQQRYIDQNICPCGSDFPIPGLNVCENCTAVKKSRKKKLQNILNESKTVCKECKEDRINWLDFAHWNRSCKIRLIGVAAKSEKLLKDELTRGRWLCVICHAKETIEEYKKFAKQNKKKYALRKSLLIRRNLVKQYILDIYQGKCQCGNCDIQLTSESPEHMWLCMEMDHQPNHEKINNISTLKQYDPDNILKEELKKCKPVFRSCHRIISAYRLQVNAQYITGDALPDEWINKWSEKVYR